MIFFVVTTLIGSLALAQEKDEDAEEDWTSEHNLIEKNIEISQWFDGVAEGVDLFLVGKKVTKRKNETKVVLSGSSFTKDREGSQASAELDVNLRLPNVEDYWQLKFTTYDDNQERRIIEKGSFRKSPREKNYGATLGLFRNLGKVRTSFQPRLALQGGFKVSHVLIFESVAENEKYRFNPKLEFFANADEGPGTYLALNFNFQLNKIYSLTFINDADYKDKLHTLTVTNGLSLGQVFAKNKTFAYSLFFESTNRDEYHLEAYTLSVTWKEIIYKNILNYSLGPFVTFAKPQSFTAASGFVASFELQF